MTNLSLSFLFIISTRLIFVVLSILRNRRSYSCASHKSGVIKSKQKQKRKPLRVAAILGSGGHTTEMLSIIQHLSKDKYFPLTYIVAYSDTTSIQQFRNPSKGILADNITPQKLYTIPRSREVGQSYFTSMFTTLWSTLNAFSVVISIRPDVLICNGPRTCIPVVFAVLITRILGLNEGKLIFVESFCRVKR